MSTVRRWQSDVGGGGGGEVALISVSVNTSCSRKVLEREVEQLVLETAHDRQACACETDFQAAHPSTNDRPHPLQTHIDLHASCVPLVQIRDAPLQILENVFLSQHDAAALTA